MADHDPMSSPEEIRAADALDAEIDAVLAGRAGPGTDPALTWMATAMRTEPPASVAERVAAHREEQQRRFWRPVRIVAAVMAYLFFSHGFGNFFVGSWVSENLGEAYSPHALREGSFALMAAGVAVALGAISRRFTPVAVTVGIPLGLAFGIVGISEVQEFPAGAALHLSQGFAAIALAVTFWRLRRYSGDLSDE